MTLTGFNRPARLTSFAAALAMAGAGMAPLAAHAAVTTDPTQALAGRSFTAKIDGLTKGTQYRVLLNSTAPTDRTDGAESNSCSALTAAADVTITCTLTESTAGSYDLKVLDATGTVVQNQAVTVGTPITSTTAPIVEDRPGSTSDSITFTYTPGVEWTYTLTGGTATKVDFGTNPSAGATKTIAVPTAGDVMYSAAALAGYGFVDAAPTGTLRLTSSDPVGIVSVPSASQPVKVDQVRLSNDQVTLTKVPNVTWNIVTTDTQGKETLKPVAFGDGNTVTVPVAPAGDAKTVTLAAVADTGYAFAGGQTQQRVTLTYTDTKAEPTITRVAGTTRFDTAVEIAKKYFPGERTTVYVANGMNFPDALAAGPAAASESAPLLLTAKGSIQANVLDEIRRMKPKSIKVVGGADVVSDDVAAELAKIGAVTRIEGGDRFATAAKVSSSRGATQGTVYIANGMNFPDALAGGSGAAREDASMLLTAPKAMSDETIVELRRLNPKKVVLVGGTDVVSTAVQRQVGDILGTGVEIVRAAGATRFETSALIIENVTGKSYLAADGKTSVLPTTAFLATGLNFPDALAGIPAAHVAKAPLALVRNVCQPVPVKTQLDKLPLTETVRLGSANVVGDWAMSNPGC